MLRILFFFPLFVEGIKQHGGKKKQKQFAIMTGMSGPEICISLKQGCTSVPSTFYHKFELFLEEWKLEQEPTENNQLNIIEKLSF